MAHDSSGKCPQCQKILNAYPGLHQDLREWFEGMQSQLLNFHVSCAGRGKAEQEDCVRRGASRAHYGQSAHNYNMALDVFFIVNGQYALDEVYFKKLLFPNYLEWYGRPEYKNNPTKFYERPHIEVLNWKSFLAKGIVKLVE